MTCSQCGASTPLPADLRIPTFHCAYCNAALSTTAYAGVGAVRVDEMGAFFNAVVESGSAEGHVAPKLVHGTAGMRRMPCFACTAEIEIPLDVTISRVTCTSCGRDAAVNRYISDVERLQIDMARQVSGNAELKRLIAEGVQCKRCNAQNTFGDPVPVQLECTSCRGVILISDYVASDAVDRSRLRANAYAMRDNLIAKRTASGNRNAIVIVAIIVVVIAIALGIALTR